MAAGSGFKTHGGMPAILIGMLLAGNALAQGPWRASEANTRGWQLMTHAERIEHQRRVRSFTRWEDCVRYREQHHQQMEARARERGLPLPAGGRDFCAHLGPPRAPSD